MKKIACFCIPAHGHTNPMLPVAAELVRRGNVVRFYSFSEFEKKITATGAEFISCDSYLPELTEQEEKGLKSVSTTEMTIQDIRITLRMDAFLDGEFRTFQPDVVYTDSVCFWGKLNAWKHGVPMVVSTSTFAFNQMSSQYMKHSPKEMADLIFGLPKISKELKTQMEELAKLTDRLSVEVIAGGEGAPSVKLYRKDGSFTGLGFHGVPGGHEFTSFVMALYNAAGPGQVLDPEVREKILGLKKTDMKVLVTLSCTMCPELVMAAQRIASIHPQVTAEIFDVMHFPQLREQYNVMSVPCLVVNDGETVTFGKKNLQQLLDIL